MNKRGQIIQLLLPIQKFFLRRLQRPVTIHAERSRESPFLLEQEEENGSFSLGGAKTLNKAEKI